MLVFLLLTHGCLACYPRGFLTALFCTLKAKLALCQRTHMPTSDFIVLASFLFSHGLSSRVVVCHHYCHLPLGEAFIFAGQMAHCENRGPDLKRHPSSYWQKRNRILIMSVPFTDQVVNDTQHFNKIN